VNVKTTTVVPYEGAKVATVELSVPRYNGVERCESGRLHLISVQKIELLVMLHPGV